MFVIVCASVYDRYLSIGFLNTSQWSAFKYITDKPIKKLFHEF